MVTFNTDNPDSKRLAFAGQDLVAVGPRGRQADGHGAGRQGQGDDHHHRRCARNGRSTARRARARRSTRSPGIEVVKTLNTGTDPQKIYSEIENAMLANPSVTGVLSLECCSTPAAGTWVKRNGAAGKVKVVGFDLLDQTVQLVEEGEIQATIDQAPEKQGFAGRRPARQVPQGHADRQCRYRRQGSTPRTISPKSRKK